MAFRVRLRMALLLAAGSLALDELWVRLLSPTFLAPCLRRDGILLITYVKWSVWGKRVGLVCAHLGNHSGCVDSLY